MTICIYLHFGKPIFQSYHFGMVHTTHLQWFEENLSCPNAVTLSPALASPEALLDAANIFRDRAAVWHGMGFPYSRGFQWISPLPEQPYYPLVSSGKHTKSYWKWPSRNSWFTHLKWWFSIVMLVYQRALGKLCITTSLFSLTGIVVNKGYHPNIAKLFRFVKYYNLPRYYKLGYSWTSYD